MPKNIVILCDGTSNEISESRTNILRLYGCLRKNDDQIVYYDPGVGTFGGANDWLKWTRKAKEVWGLATGWGLDQNVLEAYRFLVSRYEFGGDDDGATDDEIYMFGFSRGAYTVRVLAGLVHAIGLIHPDNLNLLTYAYRAFKDIGEDVADENDGNAFAEIRLFERMLQPRRPSIKLLGLLDTVGSVIESGRRGPRLRSHAFTRKNPSVQHVRHAVAIDERRTMFEPQLWPAKGQYRANIFDERTETPQDIKEVWFAGSHGDVGGGYPEADSMLAKVPLKWMIDETKALGLQYVSRTVNRIVLGKQKDKNYVKPNQLAPINDSMNWKWRCVEYLPRRVSSFDEEGNLIGTTWRVPNARRRKIPDEALIHSSVATRIESNPQLRPDNLPKHPNFAS